MWTSSIAMNAIAVTGSHPTNREVAYGVAGLAGYTKGRRATKVIRCEDGSPRPAVQPGKLCIDDAMPPAGGSSFAISPRDLSANWSDRGPSR